MLKNPKIPPAFKKSPRGLDNTHGDLLEAKLFQRGSPMQGSQTPKSRKKKRTAGVKKRTFTEKKENIF